MSTNIIQPTKNQVATATDGGQPAPSAQSEKDSEDEKDSGPKERRLFEINQIFDQTQKDRKFCDNKVTTTKYTCLNFLPKNGFIQFTKVANAYFLCCVLLQIIPGVGKPYGELYSLAPLLFVVGVSMIKDIIEDNKRRKQDTIENMSDVMAAPLGSKTMQPMRSLQLQVGCIVKVKNN